MALLTMQYTHDKPPEFAIILAFLAGCVEFAMGVLKLGKHQPASLPRPHANSRLLSAAIPRFRCRFHISSCDERLHLGHVADHHRRPAQESVRLRSVIEGVHRLDEALVREPAAHIVLGQHAELRLLHFPLGFESKLPLAALVVD